mmetsp:Transcript_7295/g.11712  ORF Transcript_7295/g.11712 Transcript_7295/m.11712 type:complete len:290 (+) Transcript_7295:1051-1920(+)
MFLNVMESMLGNVGDTSVGVLPHTSRLGFDLSNEKLDHGGFSSTILSDAGNTRAERHLHRDIEQSRRLVDRVGIGALGHLHERLSLGSDSIDGTRLGEPELELRLSERKVRAGTGLDLDKLVQVTLVDVKFQVLNLQNVGAAIVEKARIVGHNDGSHFGKRVKVLLHPGHIDNVQMVGGFVHEQDIGILKHGTRQGELHTPSSRQSGHGMVRLGLAIRHESDSREHGPHFFLGAAQSLDLGIDNNVFDTTQVRLFSLDISLDENGTNIGTVGETFHGVVGNGSHEGGLA